MISRATFNAADCLRALARGIERDGQFSCTACHKRKNTAKLGSLATLSGTKPPFVEHKGAKLHIAFIICTPCSTGVPHKDLIHRCYRSLIKNVKESA